MEHEISPGRREVVWRGPPSDVDRQQGQRLISRRLFGPTSVGKTVAMSARKEFSAEEARQVGEAIGIDWESAPFDVEQLRRGMEVELEHGLQDPATNVTDDDPAFTAKIALAHLNEFPDYYTRLQRMEQEAERENRTD